MGRYVLGFNSVDSAEAAAAAFSAENVRVRQRRTIVAVDIDEPPVPDDSFFRRHEGLVSWMDPERKMHSGDASFITGSASNVTYGSTAEEIQENNSGCWEARDCIEMNNRLGWGS